MMQHSLHHPEHELITEFKHTIARAGSIVWRKPRCTPHTHTPSHQHIPPQTVLGSQLCYHYVINLLTWSYTPTECQQTTSDRKKLNSSDNIRKIFKLLIKNKQTTHINELQTETHHFYINIVTCGFLCIGSFNPVEIDINKYTVIQKLVSSWAFVWIEIKHQ